jgi:hypothetical protein
MASFFGNDSDPDTVRDRVNAIVHHAPFLIR